MSSFSYGDAVRGLTQKKPPQPATPPAQASNKGAAVANEQTKKKNNATPTSPSKKMNNNNPPQQTQNQQEGGKKKPNKRRKNKPKLANMSMSDLIPDFLPEKRKVGPSQQSTNTTPQSTKAQKKPQQQQHTNANNNSSQQVEPKKNAWGVKSGPPSNSPNAPQPNTQQQRNSSQSPTKTQSNATTGAQVVQETKTMSWAAISMSSPSKKPPASTPGAASATASTPASASASASGSAKGSAWGQAPASKTRSQSPSKRPPMSNSKKKSPSESATPELESPPATADDFPALSSPTSSSAFPALPRTTSTSGGAAQTMSPSKKSPTPIKILKKGQTLPPSAKQSNNNTPVEKQNPNTTKQKQQANSNNNSKKNKKSAAAMTPSPAKNSFAAFGNRETKSDLDQRLLDNMPKPKNDLSGDEHALIRLMQDGKMTVKSKGRQRIKPRKKKLTALKKKVLMERLRMWRELHPEESNIPSAAAATGATAATTSHANNTVAGNNLAASPTSGAQGQSSSSKSNDSHSNNDASRSVCIYGYTELEDLEDDDEYEEIVSNLQELANKFGKVSDVFIPRDLQDRADNDVEYPAFVRFATQDDARAAIACWSGLTIGGQSITAIPLALTVDNDNNKVASKLDKQNDAEDGQTVINSESGEDEEEWQRACIQKEAHLANGDSSEGLNVDDNDVSTAVVLEDILTEDDLDDEDCLDETVQDVKAMAENFGNILDVQIKQGKEGRDIHLIYEGGTDVVKAIVHELGQVTLGGSLLSARLLLGQNEETISRPPIILLENVLSEDDLEDEECLEECLSDIRQMVEEYGPVDKLDATGEGNIVVTYQEGTEQESLANAVSKMDGMCLGGQMISAKLLNVTTNENDGDASDADSKEQEFFIILRNVLTEEDMEDEECLEESLNDVRELAKQYGTVMSEIETAQEEDESDNFVIKIHYASSQEAKAAFEGFNGMVIGGETVAATLHIPPEKEDNGGDSNNNNGVNSSVTDSSAPATTQQDQKASPKESEDGKEKEDDKPEVMFSGDKRIPERFAECKRVPKVPNKGVPRSYALLVDQSENGGNNEEEGPTAKDLLREMLAELMRLQVRAVQAGKNVKTRRRIIMGLREVARGMKTQKIKMVVMANNLDEYGVIDDKLQEILDLARENGIPVLFELSKRALGKAIGKSIKVAVVGIQNTDGAHRQYVKLSALAPKLVQ